jgi:hypothetical protein
MDGVQGISLVVFPLRIFTCTEISAGFPKAYFFKTCGTITIFFPIPFFQQSFQAHGLQSSLRFLPWRLM